MATKQENMTPDDCKHLFAKSSVHDWTNVFDSVSNWQMKLHLPKQKAFKLWFTVTLFLHYKHVKLIKNLFFMTLKYAFEQWCNCLIWERDMNYLHSE